jgi:uncharacterized protein YceK
MGKVSIKVSTAFALAFTLSLSGCSSSQTAKQESSQTAPSESTCSQSDIDSGSAWIKGQLAAFAKGDFKSAYGFASDSFRSGPSLEEFKTIISVSYGFLLNSSTYSVSECALVDGYYFFDVLVTDASDQQYPMLYALEKTTDAWGINAANVVTGSAEAELITPIV